MNAPLIIQSTTENDCLLVGEIILRNALPELPQEAHCIMRQKCTPEAILERFNTNSEFFIAKIDNSAIGVCGIRGNRHLSHLFVDKEHRKKGVASALWRHYLQLRPELPDIRIITVNSALNATGLYEKFGFKRTGDMEVKDRIPYFPMALDLTTGINHHPPVK